ncbi:hypothetical protein EHP00_1747 [Ecytonucleospora hepatopenaei]|uniref:Uncharacterized protein n=1 Tax=Ecytonucleospora hepatopenaei TaxID=646526 RepID=A0A1W0E6W5_9MICR|nr:hypothetical protein EHP00_1747 [Ecytonucleospora hepatopenaei]
MPKRRYKSNSKLNNKENANFYETSNTNSEIDNKTSSTEKILIIEKEVLSDKQAEIENGIKETVIEWEMCGNSENESIEEEKNILVEAVNEIAMDNKKSEESSSSSSSSSSSTSSSSTSSSSSHTEVSENSKMLKNILCKESEPSINEDIEVTCKIEEKDGNLVISEEVVVETDDKLEIVEEELIVSEDKINMKEEKLEVSDDKMVVTNDKIEVTESSLKVSEDKLEITEDEVTQETGERNVTDKEEKEKIIEEIKEELSRIGEEDFSQNETEASESQKIFVVENIEALECLNKNTKEKAKDSCLATVGTKNSETNTPSIKMENKNMSNDSIKKKENEECQFPDAKVEEEMNKKEIETYLSDDEDSLANNGEKMMEKKDNPNEDADKVENKEKVESKEKTESKKMSADDLNAEIMNGFKPNEDNNEKTETDVLLDNFENNQNEHQPSCWDSFLNFLCCRSNDA